MTTRPNHPWKTVAALCAGAATVVALSAPLGAAEASTRRASSTTVSRTVPTGTATATLTFAAACGPATVSLIQGGTTLVKQSGPSPVVATASVTAGTLSVKYTGPCRSRSYALSVSSVAAVPATPPSTLAPPSGKVILGAFVQLPGMTSAQSLSTLETQIGRKIAINTHYYDWADTFPGAAESADVAAGRTPHITWWGTSLSAITNGSQDAAIKARAASIKAFGAPVYIRWGAEMNGNWYAWSGSANGNNPAAFVAAWRRIHDLFVAAGATNVAWVWAPNADSHPGGTDTSSWNNWRNYYPGDAYVDWVGIDGYNWGTTGGNTWQTMGQVMNPIYNDYAGKKPIMLAETGSVETGGDKAAWIADAAAWMKSHPAVAAFVWFDTNQSSSGLDWRVDSSSTSLSAYRTVANDTYFSGLPG